MLVQKTPAKADLTAKDKALLLICGLLLVALIAYLLVKQSPGDGSAFAYQDYGVMFAILGALDIMYSRTDVMGKTRSSRILSMVILVAGIALVLYGLTLTQKPLPPFS